MKKSILEIYALAVCFVALLCFVIALGIGVYDLIQITNPEFTLNAYEYERHQSNEAFRGVPGRVALGRGLLPGFLWSPHKGRKKRSPNSEKRATNRHFGPREDEGCRVSFGSRLSW